MSAARSSTKVFSASAVVIGSGRRRSRRSRQTRVIRWGRVIGSGEFSWYRMRHAGSGHVVVVLVLSLYQLRLRSIVLDPDRTVHVCDIPAARLAELHLPLVQAPHRLADAAGGVHHTVDRAAPGARADRRVLGGSGADRVLHGAVFGRTDAAPDALSR